MNEPQGKVERAVAAAVRRIGLWARGATLVVAVSGGADSLCLLGTLLALRAQGDENAPGQIVVAHLNHGLRGDEGQADAAWVESFARAHELPFIGGAAHLAAIPKNEHRSLEDAARIARYAFLRRVAAEVEAERICVGHTRDDQAETILLHLLRGAGLSGLAGMTPLAGDIARPLLEVTHSDTLAYCAARGWQPREDRTNDDTRFWRNRVRLELLPLLEGYNPNLRETLARNAALIGEDDRYLDTLVAALLKGASVERTDDIVHLSRDWLRDQPLALRRRLLGRVATDLAGRDASLEARHISQLDGLLDMGRTGKSLNLPGGLRATLEYDALTFSRAPVSAKQPAPSLIYHLSAPGCIDAVETGWRVRAWLVEAAPGLEAKTLPELPPLGHVGVQADVGRAEARVYLDADVTGEELVVRAWRPGDRFRPLGMAHEKKLQDYFADAKVPRAQRRRIPLVFNQRHLLWVGGERIDDRARLTAATRRILALQIEPLETSTSKSSSSSVESSSRPARKGTPKP